MEHEYIDQLIVDCNTAKSFEFDVNPIVIKSSEDLHLLDDCEKVIYVIEQDSSNYIQDTFDKFALFKATSDRKCPSANEPSKIMYVGSSSTGPKKRIKEHIGDGAKATYALNLKYWFEGNYTITVYECDMEPSVLQIIEDNIAYNSKPAFGKRGSNGR